MVKKITAVIGNPIKHSLSPNLHEFIYQDNKIDAEMKRFAPKSLKKFINLIKEKEVGLTAVTIPFKQEIIKYLDEVNKQAKEIGAVNTVINKKGKLTGYNTDIIGIEKTLGKKNIKNKNVLIVGAGGVSNAVAYVVKKNQGNIFCFNRTRKKAEKLVEKFGGKVVELKKIKPESIDIVINTTPLGMKGNKNFSPVSKNFLLKQHIVFDIVYNPIETKLLKNAKEKKAKILSGLDMFVCQALVQVELWQGKKIKNKNYQEKLKTII